jgi:hypothetical protein
LLLHGSSVCHLRSWPDSGLVDSQKETPLNGRSRQMAVLRPSASSVGVGGEAQSVITNVAWPFSRELEELA